MTYDGQNRNGVVSDDEANRLVWELDRPRIETLCLEPGDVVVISCKEYLPTNAKLSLTKRFEEVLPGVKVVILEQGMTISAMRLDQAEPVADKPSFAV